MPGSWSSENHPFLDQNNCSVSSPITNAYNCIAWAAGDTRRWWWPAPRRGVAYWPRGVPREATVPAFIQAYGTLGYDLCEDGKLEPGLEKIAIFVKIQDGRQVPTHASFQLESGQWTSKMGPLEDIVHQDVNDVNGPIYGKPAVFLSRPRRPRASTDFRSMSLRFS